MPKEQPDTCSPFSTAVFTQHKDNIDTASGMARRPSPYSFTNTTLHHIHTHTHVGHCRLAKFPTSALSIHPRHRSCIAPSSTTGSASIAIAIATAIAIASATAARRPCRPGNSIDMRKARQRLTLN